MTLAPGARLGPYLIVARIGAGGTGEVFHARDTRLGRDVAVKVLPEGAAVHPTERARFEQEARAASALNHPNIVTLLDIGDAEGLSFIAMELVEGRTLRELVASGPLPTRKALDLAAQIASGLAKAHGAGIVHRDLKPENVMVSKDGFVKILDFGLAKLQAPLPDCGSELETAAAPATGAGAVLGTVGYMSPEQASAGPIDFRTDQFALGVILYEMLAGRRPFQRATAAETLAAIIRDEPESLAVLDPRLPDAVRWLVERCLAKDREDRFASTSDLARDVANLRHHLSAPSVVEALSNRRGRRRWLMPAAWLALGLAVGASLAALVRERGAPPPAELRFQRLTFHRGAVLNARFARDGQSVLYGAAWEGAPAEVYAVRFDGPESRSLGLVRASLLAVSSSGEMAVSLEPHAVGGFESPGTLARVPLGGGAPREILKGVETADWSTDGKELAVARDAGALRRLEFPVGKVLFETSGWISNVRVSPDGRTLAFGHHLSRGVNPGTLELIEPDGARRSLAELRSTQGLAWSPDGRELWTGGFAFDLEGRTRRTLTLVGGGSLLDLAPGGRALVTRRISRREMVGRAPGQAQEANLSWFDWSHPQDLASDGRTVLFDEQDMGGVGSDAIYLRRTDGSPALRLGEGESLALSPDGQWALAHTPSSGRGVVLLPTGAGLPRTLSTSELTPSAGAFFTDGHKLLLSGNETGRASRLYVLELPDGAPKPISPEGVSVLNWNALAPDGRTAVARGTDGALGLYPTDGGEPRRLAGARPDDIPIRWTADGRGLFVQHGSGVPARVDVIDVASGRRRVWRELRPPDPAGVLSIGPVLLSADGESYVYSYRRQVDDLYLVEGIR